MNGINRYVTTYKINKKHNLLYSIGNYNQYLLITYNGKETKIYIYIYVYEQKEMAAYSSVLAWRIPGTAEPGGLPSLGWHRVGHD